MKEHKVHKYVRVNIGVKKEYYVYKCAIPGCPHNLPNKNLLIGRESECHSCGDTFIISKDIVIRNVQKPRCKDCRKGGPKNLRKDKPIISEPLSVDEAINLLTQGLFPDNK